MMRICVLGDLEDLTLVYVAWLAERRGFEVLRLAEAALGTEWAFRFEDRAAANGRFAVEGVEHAFGDVCGIFVRLHPQPAVPAAADDLGAGERGLLIAERRRALEYLLNRFPGVVANRPTAGRSNASKPYQMSRLAHAGFSVPRWLASNDPEAVGTLVDACPAGAVYKSCSGLRSEVRRVGAELMHRLQAGTTPVIVQEYIGGYDVRIHTVLDRCFATRIDSAGGVDYRFSDSEKTFHPTRAPEAIETLCRQVAADEGLVVAGFDFRVTDSGDWYCLEVNPVPTFLPYEMSTGQAIANAVLDAFARDRPGS